MPRGAGVARFVFGSGSGAKGAGRLIFQTSDFILDFTDPGGLSRL